MPTPGDVCTTEVRIPREILHRSVVNVRATPDVVSWLYRETLDNVNRTGIDNWLHILCVANDIDTNVLEFSTRARQWAITHRVDFYVDMETDVAQSDYILLLRARCSNPRSGVDAGRGQARVVEPTAIANTRPVNVHHGVSIPTPENAREELRRAISQRIVFDEQMLNDLVPMWQGYIPDLAIRPATAAPVEKAAPPPPPPPPPPQKNFLVQRPWSYSLKHKPVAVRKGGIDFRALKSVSTGRKKP